MLGLAVLCGAPSASAFILVISPCITLFYTPLFLMDPQLLMKGWILLSVLPVGV